MIIAEWEGRLKSLLPRKFLKILAELRKDLYNLLITDWTKFEKQPPRVMQFNVTDVCNANCTFCAYRFTKPEGVMSMRIYEKALEQYVDMGGRVIGFNPLVGEPLLDPYLFRRLEIAFSYSELDKVYLFTNGILLKRNSNIDRLLDSGLGEIHISIAGFERRKFEKIERVNRYKEVLYGIQELLKENKEKGNPVDIHIELRGSNSSSLFTPDFNRHILPVIDDIFIQKNIHFLTLFDSWGGLIREKDLPDGTSFLPSGRIKSRPCTRTFHAGVLPNGDIRACDCRFGKKGKHDELVIGNIDKESLEELWYGLRIKKIRRKFGHSDLPAVCNKCGFYFPI